MGDSQLTGNRWQAQGHELAHGIAPAFEAVAREPGLSPTGHEAARQSAGSWSSQEKKSVAVRGRVFAWA